MVRRVTAPDHFQDTRLVRMDIGNSDLTYNPGDVAVIQPSNLADSVEKFLELLSSPEFDQVLDRKFSLKLRYEGVKVPPDWLGLAHIQN